MDLLHEENNMKPTDDYEILGTSGLINQGNTCYMNSIIQCLSNCEHFRNLLFNSNLIADLIKTNNYQIEKKKIKNIFIIPIKKNFC